MIQSWQPASRQVEMERQNVMFKQVRILALCLVVAVLSACGSPGKPPSKTVLINESTTASGSGVGLTVGDALELVLEGNASTGYTWDIGFIDSVVLHSLGDPEYAEAEATDTVGEPGHYTFHFSAAGEGQVELVMIYHRPLEPNVPPLKTFQLRVTVSP
jgi:inhibitor of cysteine peptidase